ncbi:MAG: ribosome silencing factor [Lachnospiraceae bacterium]|nr:ribosome silencing factor [Lachnospiraceae bacterium]
MEKNIKEMVKIAYHALEDKKAINPTIINIEKVSVMADYFIIASGSNINQVQAMADNVTEELEKAGYECKQTEGYHSGNWILLDFNDVIIHIFNHEDRLFYDLERIWRDGEVIRIDEA